MRNEDDFHLNIGEGTCLFPIDAVSNNDTSEIIEFINEMEINEIEDDDIVRETVDTVDFIGEEKKKNWNQIIQLQSIEEGKLFLKQEGYKIFPGAHDALILSSILLFFIMYDKYFSTFFLIIFFV